MGKLKGLKASGGIPPAGKGAPPEEMKQKMMEKMMGE